MTGVGLSHLVVVAVLLAAGSGCSSGPSSEDPAGLDPRVTPDARVTPETSVTPDAPTGVVKVRFTYGERTSLYAEGARHYFQILDEAGTVVLRRDQGTEQGPGSGYADSVRLAPGRYRVETFQRGCDYTEGGRCETTLGPAQDHCAADVSVSADRKVLVSIAMALPHPCRVHVSGRPLSAGAGHGSTHGTEGKPQRFDALAIAVVLQSDRVASGKKLRSRLVVANRSDTTVIDPACAIGTGAYALVPASDPDAELWAQPIADCGGPFEMKPGFREVYTGPGFPAHNKYGDPLPPGEYLAVLEIRGLSHRLEYPVTVE